jgi:hypothetical protein
MLSGLLGGLMGGSMPGGGSAPQAGPGGMDLDALLGAMGSGQGSGAPATGGGGMADMLGGLMGGGGSAGGMGGLLGGLLGSMGGGGQTDSFGGGGGGMMLPFADTLAEKLGVSPQVANAMIMAAMGLIMSKVTQQRQGDRSAQGLTMNSLMDADYLRDSGVAAQVAQETGLDEDEAIHGLQEAIGIVGQQAPKPSSAPPQAAGDDLKGLLDSWD